MTSNPKTTFEMLHHRALEVRNYLVTAKKPDRPRKCLNRFPAGCCGFASKLLLQWLYYEEQLAGGFGVNGSFPNPIDPEWPSTHFWLEVDDLIIDITADQFDDFKIPIYISTDRTWHAQFENVRRLP